MELFLVVLGCSISLGLGIWAVNSLSPGLKDSKKLDKTWDDPTDKEK